jgi:hypothetical protein
MRGVSGERIRKAPMVHKRGAGHRNEPRVRSNSSVIVNSLRAPNQSDDAAPTRRRAASAELRAAAASLTAKPTFSLQALPHARHQSGSGSSRS